MLAGLRESQRAVTADGYIAGAYLTLEPHGRWRCALGELLRPARPDGLTEVRASCFHDALCRYRCIHRECSLHRRFFGVGNCSVTKPGDTSGIISQTVYTAGRT